MESLVLKEKKTSSNKDIFIKSVKPLSHISSDILQSVSQFDNNKLSCASILETIPDDHHLTPQQDLIEKGMVEHRWRFLDINGKLVVEISCLKNKERTYVNKNGDRVVKNVSPIFDKYVVKEYHFYCN